VPGWASVQRKEMGWWAGEGPPGTRQIGDCAFYLFVINEGDAVFSFHPSPQHYL
jgi:hypothetical protein